MIQMHWHVGIVGEHEPPYDSPYWTYRSKAEAVLAYQRKLEEYRDNGWEEAGAEVRVDSDTHRDLPLEHSSKGLVVVWVGACIDDSC